MWAASHIVTGAVIYEGVRDESRWVKWGIVLVGGFTSHWLLDNVSVFHNLGQVDWWCKTLVILFNVAIILALWGLSGRNYKRWWRKVLPPELISGVVAWLVWDLEWIIPWAKGRWFHHNDWFPRAITDVAEPKWVGLELCWMVVMLLVAIKVSKEERWKNG